MNNNYFELEKLKKEEIDLQNRLNEIKMRMLSNGIEFNQTSKNFEKILSFKNEMLDRKTHNLRDIGTIISLILSAIILFLGVIFTLNVAVTNFQQLICSLITGVLMVGCFKTTNTLVDKIIKIKIEKIKKSKKYLELEDKISEKQKEEIDLQKKSAELLKEKENITSNLQNTQKQRYQIENNIREYEEIKPQATVDTTYKKVRVNPTLR